MSEGNDVLDEILSDAPVKPVVEAQEPTPEPAEPPRNPDGTFASKEGQEPEGEPEPDEPAPEPEKPEGREGNKVPVAALQAEREKAKAMEAKLEETQRQLQQVLGQVQVLTQQRPAQPTPEPEKRPEIWEDPDGFLRSALAPIEQQMRRQTEHFSQQLAMRDHGQEAVQSAFDAMRTAMQSQDPNAVFEYRRIMSSSHPYGELVAWHQRNQTLQKIGNDPDAWLEAELAKRMEDPAFQAKMLEKARGTAQQPNGQGQPQVALPPSLNKVPGRGNDATPGDLSSEGLFNYALR